MASPNSKHPVKETRNLDKSLFHGIGWTAIFRWFAQFVSWAIMLYVARRILTPDDFGLIAMATVPIGLARIVEDFGLDAVIVQNRELTKDQLSQLGGLAIIVGLVLTAIFLALAHPVASFFGEPAVAGLISILSFTFIGDALQILPRALLQRDLAFRRLAWINALNMVVTSTALGIFATAGFSYWSLALNTISGTIVVTAVLLILRPHRISMPSRLKSLIPSMKSGSQLLMSRICWYGYTNLDQTIIGKFIGKTSLGAYSFSMTFARVPLDEVVSLVGKVVPGIFTTIQHDIVKLKRYFLMLTETLAYITFPMIIGLMLTADDFIWLALGPQWEAVITPLRILCICMLIQASQSLISHVFLWTGHFKLNMYLSILEVIMLPAGFYIGSFWGLNGVAWSWVITLPITLIPAFYFLLKILKMPLFDWVRALLPALTGCLIMAVVVLTSRFLVSGDLPYWLRLSVQAASGALSYLFVMFAFYRKRINLIWLAIRGRTPEAPELPAD
jgi:O-antigen/teichoic acid export membrane protein